MKKITLTLPRMACLRVIVLLLLLPAVACRKNNTVPAQAVSVQLMAAALEGEILNGSISTESDEEGLALWCNGGKILIGIAKLASATFTDPGNIDNAQVVYSNFGVIIRDTKTNKTWYYIQNDAQSQQRFERLSTTAGNTIVSGIEGSIRLHIS